MAVRTRRPHRIGGIEGRARAFLHVQNGCDHRCTFCIIPFGRGNSRSVPVDDVVAQARRLIENGHREIVLTGVDITSYTPGLGLLVKRILREVPELPRLRLSSIDSVEADADLLDALGNEPRLMPHLHLSLQAGDDLILKRMKRRHLRADAIAFCDQVRRLRPDVAFGGDIIAGFPTETEAMFARSLDLVDECGLTHLHVFPFSPRPGTPAARMPQVARELVKDRARRLREKGEAALRRHLDREIGARRRVLAEQPALGRTEQFTPVRLARRPSPARFRGRGYGPRRATTAGGVIEIAHRERNHGCATGQSHVISTMAELEALYPEPVYPPAKFKETARITKAYRALIEASPFFALATNGPNGLDCSPRGDPKGFVRVLDDRTVVVPDRRGNNRIDSLRNLIHDPRVALLFLIPGVSETLRIMGRATISTDPEAVRELHHAGQGAALGAGDRGRAGVLPVRQGDRALEAVGPGDQGRALDPADAGQNPGRDHRRQDRRRGARPRRAGAAEGDDLLRPCRAHAQNVMRATGTISNAEFGTGPDQRRTASRSAAFGTRG